MLDVKVDDEVIWHHNPGSQRVIVTRVGRELFDIGEGPGKHTFRLENGRENIPRQTGGGSYITTLEQDAENRRYGTAREFLKRKGLTMQGNLDLDLMEKLVQTITDYEDSK